MVFIGKALWRTTHEKLDQDTYLIKEAILSDTAISLKIAANSLIELH